MTVLLTYLPVTENSICLAEEKGYCAERIGMTLCGLIFAVYAKSACRQTYSIIS